MPAVFSAVLFMDWIIVNDLSLHIPLGSSHWPKPGSEVASQPILVTAKATVSVSQAGNSDRLTDSVNYSSLSKTIESVALRPADKVDSLEAFTSRACLLCLENFSRIDDISVTATKRRGLLRATSVSYQLRHSRVGDVRTCTYFIRDLKLATIIGIHPWERAEKQIVCLNLGLEARAIVDGDSHPFDYKTVVEHISSVRSVIRCLVCSC
jgi:FolB domain-containing protein